MTEKLKRKIKYGNDFLHKLITPNSNNTFIITYWDLWIAIILVYTFDNDLDKMINNIRVNNDITSHCRNKFEGLLNHINVLQSTLLERQLQIADILVGIDTDFIKKQTTKAKVKILDMSFQTQEKSTWMINTPRKQRNTQAMRGHWCFFPVNPEKYASLFAKLFKSSGFYTKSQSSSLRIKLENTLNKFKTKASYSEQFSLYRAFLTVVLENMNMIDDSYGEIGDLYGEVFQHYYSLDRSKLEMPPEYYFQDLLELIIWEDYGFTDSYLAEFFNSLTSTEIVLVQSILQHQITELTDLEFNYHATNAQKMLGMLLL